LSDKTQDISILLIKSLGYFRGYIILPMFGNAARTTMAATTTVTMTAAVEVVAAGAVVMGVAMAAAAHLGSCCW
jgi:hypothetical protein